MRSMWLLVLLLPLPDSFPGRIPPGRAGRDSLRAVWVAKLAVGMPTLSASPDRGCHVRAGAADGGLVRPGDAEEGGANRRRRRGATPIEEGVDRVRTFHHGSGTAAVARRGGGPRP